ncbi:unnamed protein product, partial [Rotaria sp. Silwood2]
MSSTTNVTASDTLINDNTIEEISRILELQDTEEKEQIINDVLKNGRQALVKYERILIPEIYSVEINKSIDDQSAVVQTLIQRTDLSELIKQHVYQRWKTACLNQPKIWEFIVKMKDENKEHFESVLQHTADYDSTYTKSSSILAVILQILFHGIDNESFTKTIFIDLWNSVTNKGIQGCKDFTQYISEDDLNEQLADCDSPLFLALRIYYYEQLSELFKQNKIPDTRNLYSLAADNVTKKGWLNGIESVKNKIPLVKYEALLKEIAPMIGSSVEVPELRSTSTPTSASNLATSTRDNTPLPNTTHLELITPIPTPNQPPIIGIWSDPHLASSTTTPFGNVTLDEKGKQRLYLKELRHDLATMTSCAEKTIMELLLHFEAELLEDSMFANNQGTVIPLFEKLQDQIKKQGWLSEKIQENLRDLNRHIQNHDVPLLMRSLRELLAKIRPLNIQEIQKLVEKARNAAELIRDKEVILLIGETGTGKSTTIQFLAGCKMKATKVEVEPGKFLEHITIDKSITSITNRGLKNVTTSARNKSETRYIAPVTIQLKDIFGSYETGEIILCDAPGFGDTAGPEVDIANSVGVVEAIKGCKSVKILALSSYKSLGDRGQGIQKLA